ncbi:hypothetical protein RFI_21704, partial [Reticulomyxa filosa]
TWEHFWLNEGWTVFIECKIMQQMYGDEFWTLKVCNGIRELESDVKRFGPKHEFTKLNLSLIDTDPDDAFSSLFVYFFVIKYFIDRVSIDIYTYIHTYTYIYIYIYVHVYNVRNRSAVPYQKGSTFLRYLEDTVGGPEVFAPFIHDYFETFKFSALDSYEFKDFFLQYFQKDKKVDQRKLNDIDWKLWLTEPGMPNIEKIESKLIHQVKKLVEKWKQSDFKGSEDDCKDWWVPQTQMFLDDLLIEFEGSIEKASNKSEAKEKLRAKLETITALYGFNQVLFQLFFFNTHDFPILNFKSACSKGLFSNNYFCCCCCCYCWFVRPLYRALIKNENRKKLAVETYQKNKLKYHPICAKMVAKDLENKNFLSTFHLPYGAKVDICVTTALQLLADTNKLKKKVKKINEIEKLLMTFFK